MVVRRTTEQRFFLEHWNQWLSLTLEISELEEPIRLIGGPQM